jgi:hypothetical protein
MIMVSKIAKAGLFVLLLSTVLVGAAYAEEEIHIPKVRVLGEITAVNLEARTFAINTRQGEDLRFLVIDRTKFRSPDGSINGLSDLETGMKAHVVGARHPEHGLVALMVAAGEPGDLPETFRLKGKVDGVDLRTSTFSVLAESGESQRFKVIDRTQFRSRDGAVKGLQDLEIGMGVNVVAAKTEDGLPIALIVIAGSPQTQPKRFEVIGEITNVIPGQNKFDMQTRSGESLTIMVSDRTKFRSRDGSIEDIHDLKAGMHALVAGVVGEDGSHLALLVAVGDFTDEVPRPPEFDVRAAGRIMAISDRSFTIQTRNQGSLTFEVDESTVYKSREGNIDSFDDLEVGMNAGVGGMRQDDGQLKAVIVGIGQPKQDRAPRSTDGGRDQQRDLAPSDLG